MNQIPFIPSVLTVQESVELQKSVAKDLETDTDTSIAELLDEKKKEDRTERDQ